MQIYDALMKDHEEVRELLNELVSLDEDSVIREDLINDIRDALIPHARAEERCFYNALRSLDANKGPVMHGYQEHMVAETLLRTLQAKDKIDAAWKETAIKLRNAVEHHIQDEESRIFMEARKVLTTEEAEQIGVAFEKMKAEVSDDGFMKNTLDMVANLMPPRFSKALGLDKGSPNLNA